MSAVPMKKTDIDEVQKAKLAFLVGVADLSWKLASLFLTPVIIGYVIDETTSQDNFVLYGTAVGLTAAVLYIFKIGMEANKK